MKHKKIFGISTLLFAASFLVACGSDDSNTAESSADSGADTYIIGTDTTFAPFEFENDNGDFVGIVLNMNYVRWDSTLLLQLWKQVK